MGSKTTTFDIVRSRDPVVLSNLLKVIQAAGCTVNEFNYRLIVDDEPHKADPSNPDETLRSTLDANGLLLQQLIFELNNEIQLVLTRNWDGNQNKFKNRLDNISVTPKKPQVPTQRLVSFVALVQSIFTCIDERPFADYLQEEDRDFYLKRDSSLQRLEAMQEQFIERFQQIGVDHAAAIQTRINELDKRYDEKHATLENQYQTKLAALVEREHAHEQRLKEFEAGENRLVRRKIRDDIKKTIRDRSESFELTSKTKWLRLPIATLYVALAGLFGYLAIMSFREVQPEGQTGINYLALARQVGAIAAFAATVGFFIKWNNQWFRNHADEEFKLKRFEIDFDRASWVVEMAMEWNAEKGTEIPPFLIDRLSSGLFSDEHNDASPLTPADALASAIFGSAAAVKVKAGDSEIQIDRKGLGKLRRHDDA